jgi:divalent metal cation (Fe/Co/Zn/Cd) transporter
MHTTPRSAALARGIRLEVATVVWMAAEAAIALVAGLVARSVLLAAFGFDSVIELLSGLVLLWRLTAESRGGGEGGGEIDRIERAEHMASRVSAALLLALCAFVIVSSAVGLLAGIKPEGSLLGIGVSAVAVVAMPALAFGKSRANRLIASASLRADIAETVTCAYMAGVTLLGVALSMALGLWWVQYLFALALLIWLVPETREAFEAAGNAHR